MGEAGRSAGAEARRLVALADAHEERAALARAEAERWMIGHRTERQVAGTLAPLTACGYTFLHDRGWPGARRGSRSQIDHVLVGPGGVFIVDTKSWRDVTVAGGRVFRGQADVTDDLSGLADVGVGTEGVLAELGLAPGEVHVVVVLAGSAMNPVPLASLGGLVVVGERRASAFINSFGERLTERQLAVVLGAVNTHFPVLGDEPVPLDLSVPEPVLDEPALLTVDEVAETFLAGMLAAPIEEWMAFLHPDQARLVRRSFSGPARIRGAAGTGKTVVGLHRAAYLARASTGRVVVTTFVKTLPAVLGSLLHRLAPDVVERVEFTGVHSFAVRVLRERGQRVPRGSFDEANQAFNYAWNRAGKDGPLGALDPNSRYWRDEIAKVIKGRGLTTFEQYADLPRAGRRRPLRIEQRRAVWQLHLAYEAALRERGLIDFEDLILRAEASLRETPMQGVDHVIIDEAQDLSCAMLRMLHAVVGDRPDGLTLIGDGQQTIYPGGYSLAEAGISVAGRGVVLATNYRNTREIAAFAAQVVDGDEFVDLEGGPGRADAAAEVIRTGPSPALHSFPSLAAHDAALVSHVRTLVASGVDPGDTGVLTATNRDALALLAALRAAGFGVIELESYAGAAAPLVKVGTIKRAKGLEFKQVLLARVDGSLLSPAAAGLDEGALERREIERRELYVGMTRARDGLWVGSTHSSPIP